MAAFMNIGRRPKCYNDRRDYDEQLYRKLFRFNPENVQCIADHFLEDTGETRGGALSHTRRMEIFLRTLGDPGFQQGVGVDVGVSQSTVSGIVKDVSRRIFEKRQQWIKFPNTNDDLAVSVVHWGETKRIPYAIGAIDCSHIKITKPREHGDEYVNRKGICSINGSVHDSRIWFNSDTYQIMYNNDQEAALLGDEGYGTTPWMLTPFRNPNTDAERAFNATHAKDRVVIERCFGQLKRRFPMLGYIVRLKLDNVCRYIISAFVLHNVAKYLQDPENDFDELEVAQGFDIPRVQEHAAAEIRRRGIQRRAEIAEMIPHRN